MQTRAVGGALKLRASAGLGLGWAILALLALGGCRAHPHVGRRILVADTTEGRACFADGQENYRQCIFSRVRRGLCEEIRAKALMTCPGAHDATGEPDPTVVQLPGYRP